MNIFHRHNWVEQSRVFTGPAGKISMGGMELRGQEVIQQHYEYLNRVTFGVTEVALKCLSCGDMKTWTLLGEHQHRQSA